MGIEEEMLLFDPETREVVPRAPEVLAYVGEHGRAEPRTATTTHELDHELFRHQLETRTAPSRDGAVVFSQLLAARRTAGEAAHAAGVAIGVCGTVPLGGATSVVTANTRYLDMVETFGEIARTGGTCGTHVHVEVGSDEEGVGVIDRIGPWLPALLAMSANSPFVGGRDTSYASWRAQMWVRWPSAGPTEPFGSVAGYREASRAMLESGAASDTGMLYFDARLSVNQPTVEVRVCDACTDPADTVLLAVLVRAMVEVAAREWAEERPAPRWRAEGLRAAGWRASRYGLADTLVHPRHRVACPAREVLDDLVAWVRPALQEAGDLRRVARGVERVLRNGGAARQRAAYQRTGRVADVVDDLIARTAESWHAEDAS